MQLLRSDSRSSSLTFRGLATVIALVAAMGCGGVDRSPDAAPAPGDAVSPADAVMLDAAPAPGDTVNPADAHMPDADVQPDSPANPSCSKYPTTSRTDGSGTTWYWWYLHWQSASTDLGAFCASFGSGASIVVEVAVPKNPSPTTTLPVCTFDEIWKGTSRACAVAGAYRFEARCSAGELLFELPSENTFDGFYHFESAQLPGLPRHIVMQDVHCARDLYIPAPGPGPIDAGAPTDVADGGACRNVYTAPGCGDVKPACWQSFGETSPAIGVYYCNCAGKTITGWASGAEEPYQFKGCCPGDTGFGPLWSYACPADGGLPFIAPKDAAADSPGTD